MAQKSPAWPADTAIPQLYGPWAAIFLTHGPCLEGGRVLNILNIWREESARIAQPSLRTVEPSCGLDGSGTTPGVKRGSLTDNPAVQQRRYEGLDCPRRAEHPMPHPYPFTDF